LKKEVQKKKWLKLYKKIEALKMESLDYVKISDESRPD